jgi:hypothetical protein
LEDHPLDFMQSIQAHDLMPLSIQARAKLIKQHADLVDVPSRVNSDLHRAYQLASVLTPVLPDFIKHQIREDIASGSILTDSRQSTAIADKCEQFSENLIALIPKLVRSSEEMELSPRNLYEMCGATEFIKSNSISRALSTRMGELWEKIARISPAAVSPEQDFGLKITGIDIIICPQSTQIPIFTQLKTACGTLTGSQVPRSRSELGIHEHSLFAAAFCLEPWTFGSPTIQRCCGSQF